MRSISLVAAAALLTAPLTGGTSVTYHLGDVDGSGAIDALDALAVLSSYEQRSAKGTDELSGARFTAADVNRDGSVDTIDASLILSYYAHVSTGGKMMLSGFLAMSRNTHSVYYVEGCMVDNMVEYFTEIVNSAEYTNDNESAGLVQKWNETIMYYISGEASPEDIKAVEKTAKLLNSIVGFPRMRQASSKDECNMDINFVTDREFKRMFDSDINSESADGAVTFWFNNDNEITRAVIGICISCDQETRCSVIAEEIVNGLGVCDSELRPDSIVYQYDSTATEPSEIDLSILELLYSRDIKNGMTASECEEVIRRNYF